MLFDGHGRPVRRSACIVRHIDLQRTASLAAGAGESDDFIVPSCRSWLGRRSRIQIAAPTTATAGSHGASVVCPGLSALQTIHVAWPAHNVNIDADADITSMGIAAGRTLRLTYSNATNVAQTNPRNWHITLIEEVA
jgi:hypothetical protein